RPGWLIGVDLAGQLSESRAVRSNYEQVRSRLAGSIAGERDQVPMGRPGCTPDVVESDDDSRWSVVDWHGLECGGRRGPRIGLVEDRSAVRRPAGAGLV